MSKPLKRQILERARTLISDENHWCRGALGRDVYGNRVDPTDPTALRRCAFGALMAAAVELVADPKQARALAHAIAQETCGTNFLIHTNDVHGHAAALALFDKALAL